MSHWLVVCVLPVWFNHSGHISDAESDRGKLMFHILCEHNRNITTILSPVDNLYPIWRVYMFSIRCCPTYIHIILNSLALRKRIFALRGRKCISPFQPSAGIKWISQLAECKQGALAVNGHLRAWRFSQHPLHCTLWAASSQKTLSCSTGCLKMLTFCLTWQREKDDGFKRAKVQNGKIQVKASRIYLTERSLNCKYWFWSGVAWQQLIFYFMCSLNWTFTFSVKMFFQCDDIRKK